MTGPKTDIFLSGDLANVIAALELAGRNFDGEYGRGWAAALAALGVAVGTIRAPDALRERESSAAAADDGWSKLGPGAFGAFR